MSLSRFLKSWRTFFRPSLRASGVHPWMEDNFKYFEIFLCLLRITLHWFPLGHVYYTMMKYHSSRAAILAISIKCILTSQRQQDEYSPRETRQPARDGRFRKLPQSACWRLPAMCSTHGGGQSIAHCCTGVVSKESQFLFVPIRHRSQYRITRRENGL